MAAVIDVSLLNFLIPFFIFLFILVVIYALLQKTELFGKNQVALNLTAAICVSAVATFAGTLLTPLKTVIPWIVFIIVILAMLFALFGFFGVENKEVWEVIGGKTPYFVIIVLIVFVSLVALYEPEVSPFEGSSGDIAAATAPQGQNVQSEVVRTFTHPRLLAALFILIVSSFSIRLIVDKIGD